MDSQKVTCLNYITNDYCTSSGGLGSMMTDNKAVFENYSNAGFSGADCKECGCIQPGEKLKIL